MPRSARLPPDQIEMVKMALLRRGFFTQGSLANHLGMSRSTVSKFLNGKPVDVLNFEQLCVALGLDIQGSFLVSEGEDKSSQSSIINHFPLEYLSESNVPKWNQWRHSNLPREPDISDVSLAHTDLRNIDLSGIEIASADFRYADLRGANFSRTRLRAVNLSFANLLGADFSGSLLNDTNFMGADLVGSNLRQTQALNTNFKNADLTGSCIADWQIGSSTLLQGIKCDYIFRTYNIEESIYSGRLPVDPERTFAPGEFEQWMQVRKGALDTIDITFSNGIDWQAFFQSLQVTRQKYPDTNITLQSIEQDSGIFVARLKIETDEPEKTQEKLKANIETQIKVSYKRQLTELKMLYERELTEAHGEIKALERSLDKALEKLALTSKYTFHGTVGNINGDVTTYINQNNEEIGQLITALRSSAQSFPVEQQEEVLMELEDLARDLENPQKAEPKRISKRLQRLIAAGRTAAQIAGEAAILSGNLNEFSKNILKLGENVGIARELILDNQINP